MAVIDVAGYVAELKDHAVDHKFHVHDERHFVETYSLRQFWEVDLHPEEGCGGPIDLHLALEVEPRVLLDFEDAVVALPEDEDPPDKWFFPLTFNWGVPPLPKGPDLLRLAIDLAGVGGVELPLEISATDSFGSVTDAPVRRLTIVARQQVSLARVLAGEELLCDTFDRALAVTRFFLDNAPIGSGNKAGAIAADRRMPPARPGLRLPARRLLEPGRRATCHQGLRARRARPGGRAQGCHRRPCAGGEASDRGARPDACGPCRSRRRRRVTTRPGSR